MTKEYMAAKYMKVGYNIGGFFSAGLILLFNYLLPGHPIASCMIPMWLFLVFAVADFIKLVTAKED